AVGEAVGAEGAVGLDGGRAEERAQLAGGGAAEEVHLEEPLLRVDEPQRPRGVEPARRRDRRHAQAVAFDGDGGGEAGQGHLAREHGEAGVEPRVPSDGGTEAEEDEREGAVEEGAAHGAVERDASTLRTRTRRRDGFSGPFRTREGG